MNRTDSRALADRLELIELVARLGRWLDEGPEFDEPDDLFTDDVSASTPGGDEQGRDGVVAQAERVHRDRDTQHLLTGIIVDLDGDTATMTANLQVTFVGHGPHHRPAYSSGSRYRFAARRTPDGWRLSRVEVTPLWQVGERPTIAAVA